VIPIMIYSPMKMVEFSRECLRRHVAVVVVGYPCGTQCCSAERGFVFPRPTRCADLAYALQVIEEVSDLVGIRHHLIAQGGERGRGSGREKQKGGGLEAVPMPPTSL